MSLTVNVYLLILFLLIDVYSQIINYSDKMCGRSNSRQSRIVGGRNAEPNEFPWIVSIKRRGGHFCGGSLITTRHVLTAAHCVCHGVDGFINPASIKLATGQHDLRKIIENVQTFSVKRITVHPDYHCKKVVNDIAILELGRSIQWNDQVQPACLSRPKSNDIGIIAGWGWLSENNTLGNSRKPNIIQKAEVTILDNDICTTWYKSQGKKTTIRKTQLCAGYKTGGIDACWADSGGPLMIENKENNTLSLVGIVSTGIGCARPYLPGIYTRISEYLNWIDLIVITKNVYIV